MSYNVSRAQEALLELYLGCMLLAQIAHIDFILRTRALEKRWTRGTETIRRVRKNERGWLLFEYCHLEDFESGNDAFVVQHFLQSFPWPITALVVRELFVIFVMALKACVGALFDARGWPYAMEFRVASLMDIWCCLYVGFFLVLHVLRQVLIYHNMVALERELMHG